MITGMPYYEFQNVEYQPNREQGINKRCLGNTYAPLP